MRTATNAVVNLNDTQKRIVDSANSLDMRSLSEAAQRCLGISLETSRQMAQEILSKLNIRDAGNGFVELED